MIAQIAHEKVRSWRNSECLGGYCPSGDDTLAGFMLIRRAILLVRTSSENWQSESFLVIDFLKLNWYAFLASISRDRFSFDNHAVVCAYTGLF